MKIQCTVTYKYTVFYSGKIQERTKVYSCVYIYIWSLKQKNVGVFVIQATYVMLTSSCSP